MRAIEGRAAASLGLTLALAALGAAAFRWIGFPAPFLTGAAAAVSLAALAGLPMVMPPLLRHAGFLVLGLGIGAGVTPDLLASAARWPVSLAALAATLVVSMTAGAALLERGFGFAPRSAMLAATPGHLSYILGYAAEARADLPRIAVVQSVRVLLLTLLVPPLLALWGEAGSGPVARPDTISAVALAALAASGAAIGAGLLRLRVPAAMLLAGMAVSAAGHATGATPGALPGWLVVSAFTLMGAVVGTRFGGIAMAELRRALGAGLAITALSCSVAAAGAAAVAALSGLSPTLLLVAYAPGGVEAMAAMAAQLGLAPAFVAGHHLVRLLLLTILVPALLARRSDRA